MPIITFMQTFGKKSDIKLLEKSSLPIPIIFTDILSNVDHKYVKSYEAA